MRLTKTELRGLVQNLITEAPTLIGKNKIPNVEPTEMSYSGDDYAVPGGSKASFIGKIRYPNDENYVGSYFLIEDEAGYEYALYVSLDTMNAFSGKSWTGIPDNKYAVAITKSPKKRSISRRNPLSLNPQTKAKAYKAVRGMFDTWADKYDANEAAETQRKADEEKQAKAKELDDLAKKTEMKVDRVTFFLSMSDEEHKLVTDRIKAIYKSAIKATARSQKARNTQLKRFNMPIRKVFKTQARQDAAGSITNGEARTWYTKSGKHPELANEINKSRNALTEFEKQIDRLGLREGRKIRVTSSQLRHLVGDILQEATVTSGNQGNVELQIMQWTARSRMGSKYKEATAKKVSKWKEKNSKVYDGLSDDLKKKIDKLASGS